MTMKNIRDKTLFLFCNRVKDAKKLVDNTFLLRLHIINDKNTCIAIYHKIVNFRFFFLVYAIL